MSTVVDREFHPKSTDYFDNVMIKIVINNRTVACEQAHLFGRVAATESWQVEWGEFAGSRYLNKLVPKQVSLLAG